MDKKGDMKSGIEVEWVFTPFSPTTNLAPISPLTLTDTFSVPHMQRNMDYPHVLPNFHTICIQTTRMFKMYGRARR